MNPAQAKTRDYSVTAAYALWLGLAAGFCVSYVSSIHHLSDATGNLVGRDFVNMWAAAKAAASGMLDRIFDNAAYHAYLRQLFGFDLPPHNWSYPSHLIPLLAPLAFFPYLIALALWSAVGLAAYLWRCASEGAGRIEFALLALAPASLVNLITGQNGFFTAALLWTGLTLIERSPVAAGIAFGLLTIKPQLGILIPLLLLFERRWTVIVSASLTAILMLALTFIAYGPQVFTGYIEKAVPYQGYVFTTLEGIFISMMPTAFMNARLMGFDATAAWMVQIPASIAGIAFFIWVLFRTADRTLIAAGLVTATFLASPYLFNYDMTALTPALIALWGRAGNAVDRLVIGLLWALPVTCVLLGLAGIPASFAVLCLFAFWLARQIEPARKRPILNA